MKARLMFWLSVRYKNFWELLMQINVIIFLNGPLKEKSRGHFTLLRGYQSIAEKPGRNCMSDYEHACE